MSGLLLATALMLIVLGLAHSVLGEIFLLRHIGRVQRLPSLLGGDGGGERSLRAAWHNLSILGWTFALILIYYANLTELGARERFVIRTISISLVLSAVVWFAETRGKHLGWAAFLVIAILCWVAAG